MASMSLNATIRDPKQAKLIRIIVNDKETINKDLASISNAADREYKIRRVGDTEETNKVKIQSRL